MKVKELEVEKASKIEQVQRWLDIKTTNSSMQYGNLSMNAVLL